MKKKRKTNIFGFLIILLACFLIFNMLYLSDNNNKEKLDDIKETIEEKITSKEDESSDEELSSDEETSKPEESKVEDVIIDPDKHKADRIKKELKDYTYQGDIEADAAFLEEYFNKKDIEAEDIGHNYLPTHPKRLKYDNPGTQLDVPLILQKDPKWRSLKYGTDATEELGENGCAIVALAMVESYFEEKIISPKTILDWSLEDYYVHNQGTSWDIFYAYAVDFDKEFYNYGGSLYSAIDGLVNNNEVIIASVAPGYFTDHGHLLIIRGYDPETSSVYVNDPNDDPTKMFSVQAIPEYIFLNEGINYWGYTTYE